MLTAPSLAFSSKKRRHAKANPAGEDAIQSALQQQQFLFPLALLLTGFFILLVETLFLPGKFL